MTEFDLFRDIPSGENAWNKRYWQQKEAHPDEVTRWMKNSNCATVEVVLKKEDPAQDRVKAFYDAQRELARNTLPAQTKEGAQLSGATVEISEMQLRNMDEFSDQAFKTGTMLSNDMNPKEQFINFKEKPDEMKTCPSAAFDALHVKPDDNFNDKNTVFPAPFGAVWHPNMKPTSSLPEGTLAATPVQKGFKEMQELNTVDYVGNRYLPKSTQDGKKDPYLPPQFQLSSASDAKLGCLMAMLQPEHASKFVNFATQHIEPGTLAKEGIEHESHVSVLYGFNPEFDHSKLEKMLANTGPIPFTVREVDRFDSHPDYDVLHFKVDSPELELINAKLSREFPDEIEETNHAYHPHLTLAYVKKGSNKHMDGMKVRPQTFGVTKLLYSGPHKSNRHQISLAWDAQPFDDGGMQDSFQSLDKNKTNEKPLNNLGDALQAFLDKRAVTKQAEKKALEDQLKKV